MNFPFKFLIEAIFILMGIEEALLLILGLVEVILLLLSIVEAILLLLDLVEVILQLLGILVATIRSSRGHTDTIRNIWSQRGTLLEVLLSLIETTGYNWTL